jgi:hypothetical protein
MTLGTDVNLDEFIEAKDELSGADIKVGRGGREIRILSRRART